MTKYTAHFITAAQLAAHDFKADSPEKALDLALKLWERDPHALKFESRGLCPLEAIHIAGQEENEEELAVWHSDKVRLRWAADNLLDALKNALTVLASVKPDAS
ncbi:MAG: hypothetical protein ABSH41_00380 [Syntrophobacteraceae bacterium]|jgi:hypothetical protein